MGKKEVKQNGAEKKSRRGLALGLVAGFVVLAGLGTAGVVLHNQDVKENGFAESQVLLCADEEKTLALQTEYETLKWSIADESIAIVDDSGKVTGVAVGETKVTARTGLRFYQMRVTVREHGICQADCTNPSICIHCKKWYGDALGHDADEATCTADSVCKRCHATLELALGHEFCEPTCTLPATCSRCEAVDGKALGHEWADATCELPETCVRCKETLGEANGHSYKEAAREFTDDGRICITNTCEICSNEYLEYEAAPVVQKPAPNPAPVQDPGEETPSPEEQPAPAVPAGNPIYDAMIALKATYPEGTSWTNDSYYAWKGGLYSGGYGCAGFAFLLSDAAFGSNPAKMHYDLTNLRVGDIVRIYNDTHAVVILEVHSDHVIVAEGNYNDSVHWGRNISRDEIVSQGNYVITRY